MRRVPLKIVDFARPNNEPLPPLHYSEALVLIAKIPRQGGISAEEMEAPLAIEAAISVACDQRLAEDEECFVFLEEADWSWLVAKLKAHHFPFVSRVFKAMVEAVEAAPKIDPNQLNGGVPAAKSEAPSPVLATL
jgi:hypothetical protein